MKDTHEIYELIKPLHSMLQTLTEDNYEDTMIALLNRFGEDIADIVDRLGGWDIERAVDYIHYHQDGNTVDVGGTDTGMLLDNVDEIIEFLQEIMY